jgi:hypothetical protein
MILPDVNNAAKLAVGPLRADGPSAVALTVASAIALVATP